MFHSRIIIPAATLAILLFTAVDITIAQPALPSEPTQAPIGGGLGLLAAAGGAYAYRRLRQRSEQDQ